MLTHAPDERVGRDPRAGAPAASRPAAPDGRNPGAGWTAVPVRPHALPWFAAAQEYRWDQAIDADWRARERTDAEGAWTAMGLLVLAHETGHRIGAIRTLRWSDVDLDAGRVHWRADSDKMGHAHQTPLTPEPATALARARQANPAIGDAWMFPAPDDPARPCCRYRVRA